MKKIESWKFWIKLIIPNNKKMLSFKTFLLQEFSTFTNNYKLSKFSSFWKKKKKTSSRVYLAFSTFLSLTHHLIFILTITYFYCFFFPSWHECKIKRKNKEKKKNSFNHFSIIACSVLRTFFENHSFNFFCKNKFE